MKSIHVSEGMVPNIEYATVPGDANFRDAGLALEQAHRAFASERYPHRAILVLDADRRIVGKLSQMDIIKALEPDYAEHMSDVNLERFGIDEGQILEMLRTQDFWNQPLDELCAAAAGLKVVDVMYMPSAEEMIPDSATLQEAIHRLVVGGHHSLLVTGAEGGIVGVLRLTDIFATVCGLMAGPTGE